MDEIDCYITLYGNLVTKVNFYWENRMRAKRLIKILLSERERKFYREMFYELSIKYGELI